MPADLVVIGASEQGLEALRTVLGGLSAAVELAIIVVPQQWSEDSPGFAGLLRGDLPLLVLEPFDKQPIVPGRVYVARMHYHLLVEDGHFALTTEAPVWGARPSLDVLVESVIGSSGERLIGLLLGDATLDGEQAMSRVRQLGGLVIQEAVDSESDGDSDEGELMPRGDMVLSLPQIAPFLLRPGR